MRPSLQRIAHLPVLRLKPSEFTDLGEYSCSHGAVRAMSRGQATRTFTLEDHARATAGVECRKDVGGSMRLPAPISRLKP